MTAYFPDFQHVEEIRRALWSEHGLSRASVMVGSGMSRNAEPHRPGLPKMPTLGKLIEVLIDRLYPDTPATARRREKLKKEAWATSAGQRLAEEFAVAFGRPALDDLVKAVVPDLDFAPGLLHRMLLELPWADVLTTNYDTLLERATAFVA